MLLGTIGIVLKEQLQYNPNNIVINISGEQIDYPNILDASVLLPDYEATMQLVDGDINVFRGMYSIYLNTINPLQFIYLIALAIYQDKQIVMLITKDALEMGYLDTLEQSIYYNIGVNIRNGMIDYNRLTNVLFIMNLIPFEEYRYAVNKFKIPMVDSIPAIIIERFNPYLGPNPTQQDYINYIDKMMNMDKPILFNPLEFTGGD